MAMIVTYLDIGQWVVELSEPELDWLKLVSSRCCWDGESVVATALSRGLSDLVMITSQVQGGFELEDKQEVPGT